MTSGTGTPTETSESTGASGGNSASGGGNTAAGGTTGTGGSTGTSAYCMSPDSRMVAYWPAEGNAQDAVGSNDGTLVGSATATAEGQAGQAFHLEPNSAVEVPHDEALNFGLGDFSVSLWVKTVDTGTSVLLSKGTADDTGNQYGYTIFLDDGALSLQLADGSYQDYSSAAAGIADGDWHQLMISVDRDQSNGILFFVDGEEFGSADPTQLAGSLDNTAPLHIGIPSPEAGFSGEIDEVRLYHSALQWSDSVALFVDPTRCL